MFFNQNYYIPFLKRRNREENNKFSSRNNIETTHITNSMQDPKKKFSQYNPKIEKKKKDYKL
jgi:hypothetical protein